MHTTLRNIMLTMLTALLSLSVRGAGVETEVKFPDSFAGTTANQIENADCLDSVFAALQRGDSHVRILQVGDSHVRGHWWPRVMRERLAAYFGGQAMGNDKITYQSNCIATETGENGLIFSAIGVNGKTFGNYFTAAVKSRVRAQHPDLIIISFGTNEAAGHQTSQVTRARMRSFTDTLRALCPHAVLLFTTPPGDFQKGKAGRTPNPSTAVVAADIRYFCQQNGYALWDVYTIAGGKSHAALNWRNAGLMARDCIHLAGPGYDLMGKLFTEAFINAYKDYVRH